MTHLRASFVVYNLAWAALGVVVAVNPPEFVSGHPLAMAATIALLLVACGFLVRAVAAATDPEIKWLQHPGRSDVWSHAMRSTAMALFAFHSLTSLDFDPPSWFTLLLVVASLSGASVA